MTLQELLDGLNDLPASARTAHVEVRHSDHDDFVIDSVRYDGGRVIVDLDVDDSEEQDDD